MKFIGNSKYVFNEILVTFQKNFEKFWINYQLYLIQLQDDFKILSKFSRKFSQNSKKKLKEYLRKLRGNLKNL